MADPFHVLVSSAGRRVALMNTFRDALSALGLRGEVLATDMSRYASAFQLADRAWTVPRCTDPAFVPFMLDLCEREGVRLLVPTIDPELAILAEHRAAFEAVGTTVHVSSPEVIRIGADKLATHRWLTGQGLPTVRQTTPAGVAADNDEWPLPLLVKPVGGSRSIGVAIVTTPEELRAATADGDYVVQEIAPGEEYTVSVLADRQGRSVCAVPRQRLEVRAGEVQKARAVRNHDIESLARAVVDALPGAYGAMNVQVFYERESRALNIIELNPRFGGGYPLAYAAGARYSQWIIEEILGLPSTAAADRWTDGLVMLRYDDAVFVPPDRLEA